MGGVGSKEGEGKGGMMIKIQSMVQRRKNQEKDT